MEWVEPNYNMADITEYEMVLEKRRSTEDFVLQFFKNWESNDVTDKMVVVCNDLVTDLRLQRMVNEAFIYSSVADFSQSYRKMCSELFSKNIEDYHITVLFAFSIVYWIEH